MSFQIRHVVVYGRDGRQRLVTFELGQLNIITGSSRRGKSAVLTIIDYCLGSRGYPVKAGVTRDHSIGFGLMIVSNGRTMFVGRPAPERLKATADRMHVSIVADSEIVPGFTDLAFNTNVETAKQIVGDLCGIDSSLRLPRYGSAAPIPPTIRHALFFVLQEQNEISNPDVLFHGQGEEERPATIRAVIPYFIGAVDTEYATLTIRLRVLKRELAALQRTLAERAQAIGATGQARALLAEAVAVGLLGEQPQPDVSEALAVSTLRDLVLADITYIEQPDLQTDQLENLSERRRELRAQISGLNLQISRLRRASSENGDFVTEANEQHARLASLTLLPISKNGPSAACPICGNEANENGSIWADMNRELSRLSDEVVAVRTDTPKIDQMIASLTEDGQRVGLELRANKAEIEELQAGMQAISRLRDAETRMALVQGRIGLYLEMLDRQAEQAPLQDRTAELVAAIADVEARLDENGNPDLINTFLSLISRDMSEKARLLLIEHSEWPIRLDLRRLTVVADTRNGAVPLSEMGSAENHLGYHLAAFLALHEWFVQEHRPVPRTLIMDQPSQVWFPSDNAGDGRHILRDDDRDALVRAYSVIRETVSRLAPDFQVIVMEHADLEEPWFRDAVQYRWRDEGEALIPADWIEEP